MAPLHHSLRLSTWDRVFSFRYIQLWSPAPKLGRVRMSVQTALRDYLFPAAVLWVLLRHEQTGVHIILMTLVNEKALSKVKSPGKIRCYYNSLVPQM